MRNPFAFGLGSVARPSWRRTAMLLVGIVGMTAWSSYAWAYCRTTTCETNPRPDTCNGTYDDTTLCSDEGTPLFWPSPCISFSVNTAGSPRLDISADQLQDVVATAFQRWLDADCGDGSHPDLSIETYPQVDCSDIGYKENGPNQNQWAFRDDDWPYGATIDGVLALTLLTVNTKSGEIYDVDVEFNSYQSHFTLDTVNPDIDLPSVVQHESGHFLGLDHSNVQGATMQAGYSAKDLSMRTLAPDDEAGICNAVPPDSATGSCDAEPRHGFSTSCTKPSSQGCSIAAAGLSRRPGTEIVIACFGLMLSAAAVRRRSETRFPR